METYSLLEEIENYPPAIREHIVYSLMHRLEYLLASSELYNQDTELFMIHLIRLLETEPGKEFFQVLFQETHEELFEQLIG